MKTLDIDNTSITDLKAMIKGKKLTPGQLAKANKSIAARRAHRREMDAGRAKPAKKAKKVKARAKK